MPYPYQVWLRQLCLDDYVATLKAAVRNPLLTWIESLASDFSQAAGFEIRGTEDRNWQVSILGSHAVVWWVDHAACELKIVAIRKVDR